MISVLAVHDPNPPHITQLISLPSCLVTADLGFEGQEGESDFEFGDSEAGRERHRVLLHRVRQVLLHVAGALDLPANPLDDIIERLGGAAKVAEMTGRKSSVVSAEPRADHIGRRGCVKDALPGWVTALLGLSSPAICLCNLAFPSNRPPMSACASLLCRRCATQMASRPPSSSAPTPTSRSAVAAFHCPRLTGCCPPLFAVLKLLRHNRCVCVATRFTLLGCRRRRRPS